MINKDDKTTEGGPSKSKKSPAKPTKGHKLGSQTQGITINDHGLSTTRLIQAAEMISKPMLNTAAGPPWGLPTKYFHYGKKLSAYKDTRNHGAHRSEGAFARLLLHDIYRDTHIYHEWGGLLEWVFDKSLEDLASTDSTGTETENELIDSVLDADTSDKWSALSLDVRAMRMTRPKDERDAGAIDYRMLQMLWEKKDNMEQGQEWDTRLPLLD
ncbi:MAG: hypothetical protein Q9194_006412 [Teloschistes cf. exilis]